MKFAKKCMVYVGTASSNESRGIYSFEMDLKTGQLQPVEGPVKIYNPSYLALDHKNRYLYSVTQTDKYNGETGGAVAAFFIDPHTGKLHFINEQPAHGKSLCHLSVDRMNQCLFVADYHNGALMTFPVLPDGSLAAESRLVAHSGSGPDLKRQEKAHVHFVSLTPDEKYLCVADLGIDQVKVYGFDSSNGVLSAAECFSLHIRPGYGPRHMEFHPDGRHAYLVNELVSSVTVLKYNPAQLLFEAIQYISTLPADYSGISYGAAVHVSPDGKFLFTSNRGHDTIAIFSIDQDSGTVEPVSYVSTGGSWPRDFAMDPTGRFLFAANQDSDNIVPFKMNYINGELERNGDAVLVSKPTCIKSALL